MGREMARAMTARKGYTLLELLAAIAVMSIVVGVACGIWLSSVRQGAMREQERDVLVTSWLRERRCWLTGGLGTHDMPSGDSSIFLGEFCVDTPSRGVQLHVQGHPTPSH